MYTSAKIYYTWPFKKIRMVGLKIFLQACSQNYFHSVTEVTVSLVVPEESVSEDSGAVLVLVKLEGDLEVDIVVTVETQNRTGMYLLK